MKKKYLLAVLIVILLILVNAVVYAESSSFDFLGKTITLNDTDNPNDYVASIKLLIILTLLTLAPAILIMMTSFTRIIIVLSFIRNALSTQQTPPNQVLIGLALFLTFFIMSPVVSDINNNAIQPYVNNEITQQQAQERMLDPIKKFMFNQTRDKDLALFIDVGKINLELDEGSNNDRILEQIPIRVLIPAFIISELKTAFTIGFILFIPFLIIDMVVASTLMSMGMMMLPPVMISLPFKILLFIMVDGWHLIVKALITGFN